MTITKSVTIMSSYGTQRSEERKQYCDEDENEAAGEGRGWGGIGPVIVILNPAVSVGVCPGTVILDQPAVRVGVSVGSVVLGSVRGAHWDVSACSELLLRHSDKPCLPLSSGDISRLRSHWSRSFKTVLWLVGSCQLSYAIMNQLRALKATYWGHFLPFAGSLWHKGGFYAPKDTIRGGFHASIYYREQSLDISHL